MNHQIRSIALLLALILLLCGCTPTPITPTQPTLPSTAAPTQPTTLPTEPVITEPPTEATEPPTEPTEPPTEPTTVPTEPPTEPPTEIPTQPPTQPPTKPTDPPPPPEPPFTTKVTIGPEVSGISAKKAFVYDCSTGSFLYMKSEPLTKIYPASITKLMTAYTASFYIDPDEIVTVTKDMTAIVPIDTSMAGLYWGDKLTISNLYKAMLVPSGSDAAHILAVFVGRKLANNPNMPAQAAEDRFVEEMNRRAGEMGLQSSHFVNCDGYPNYYHYTCMADLVVIASRCLDTPLIRNTVCNAYVTLTYADGHTRSLSSTNNMLRPSSAYYRKEARGMKTGTSTAAGSCLLGAYLVEGRYILTGVFQCPSNTARYECSTKLFDTFSAALRPTEPTEPPTEPTVPPTVPTEPPTVPTEPPTVPTEPPTEPSEPPTEPTVPPTEPSEPPTEPTVPPTEPSEPPTEPTVPPTEPSEPPTKPTEPPTEPSVPPTEPSEPPTEPTEPPTEPSVPPTEPSVPPTEPSEPPTEPTVPPTEPSEPPTKPTEPPTEPSEPATDPQE